MTQFIDTLVGIFQSSGFAQFGEPGGWLYAVMICVGCFLLYLAIVKEFEPLILLPMAFGMILANLPGSGVIHMQYFVGDGLEHPMWVEILNNGGLADMLYTGATCTYSVCPSATTTYGRLFVYNIHSRKSAEGRRYICWCLAGNVTGFHYIHGNSDITQFLFKASGADHDFLQ